MKRMIDFIFRPKSNPNYEVLKKDGVYDALRLALIITPLFIMAIGSTLLVSFTWTDSYIKSGLQDDYRFYYTCVLVFEILYAVLLLFIRKNYDERYHLLPRVNIFMMAMLLWYATNIARLDYMTYGNRMTPIIFMVMSICIPFTLYLDVRVYLVITLISNLLIIRLYLLDGIDAAFNQSNLGDFLYFSSVQVLLGMVVYYYKYSAKESVLEQEAQKEEIRKLNLAQSTFFSSMSHEIRTPINTIIGLNEMILRQNASPEINEDAENIQAASKSPAPHQRHSGHVEIRDRENGADAGTLPARGHALRYRRHALDKGKREKSYFQSGRISRPPGRAPGG